MAGPDPHGGRVIRVDVAATSGTYEVLVGEGVAPMLADVVAQRLPAANLAIVVTDETVAAQSWFADIDPGIPFHVQTVGPGEAAKTLDTAGTLCRTFAQKGLSRTDVVVAVGGGVVSDLAGFAAACYHRGVAYCTVATTLLAQVDAAVGGKTGVNLPEGKNLVGAFWQPSAVLCDTELLATLPAAEWASGRGEMAKYAFLGEPRLADLDLTDQVARCVALKAAMVGADEREHGPRVLLNYGHTLAHALEAASFRAGAGAGGDGDDGGGDGGDGGIRHGEAVAIGLVYAAVLARRLGRIDDARVASHRAVVGRLGLAARVPAGISLDDMVEFMARDKKAHHDLSFVLDGPDGLELVHGVPLAEVRGALEELAAS